MDTSGLNAAIRECVIDPAQELYRFGVEVYNEIENTCSWIDQHVDVLMKSHLAPNVHHVAMTIFRAIPETLVCAACMTGVGVGPAVVYWSFRVIKVSWPLISEILAFQLDTSVLSKAAAQSLKDLFEAYKGFRPAIAACAAVAGVAAFVFGWVTADYPMMIRSTIYSVVAQLAVVDIARDREDLLAHVPAAPGNAKPQDTAPSEPVIVEAVHKDQEGVPHSTSFDKSK